MRFSDAEVRCAVVILAMVHAENREEPACAGVAFSCDPRTGRRHVVVVNAARGMGDKVVQGSVDPDQYLIVAQQGGYRIEKHQIRDEPVLTEKQQRELARSVWRIHWALGEGQDPQDVEWAHDGRTFWFVQARPVTRVPKYVPEGCKRLPIYWSTANIKDAIPGVVSVASWSFILEAIDTVLYSGLIAAGASIMPGMQTVRRFEGRAYFDQTSMQWLMYETLGVLPADIVKSIGGHQPEIPVPAGDPLKGPDGRRRQRNRMTLAWSLLNIRRRMNREDARHLDKMREYSAMDFGKLDNSELLDWLESMENDVMRINSLVGLANNYSGIWQTGLEALLLKVAPDQALSLMNRLLVGGGDVTSAE